MERQSEIVSPAQNKSNDEVKRWLINAFKHCLNILRDNEGLTGEKALRTISYLLILKLLEPHFGNEINIDDYPYDFSHIEDDAVESHKRKLLSIVRFSQLSQEKEDNIPNNMKYLWDDILSTHPTTKHIFLKDKGFDIQHKTTYKKLIDCLYSLDLSTTDHDILGNAYEEVIQDIMTGKVFGQYFTQPLVKKMMVRLIDPQLHPDGTIDTCGDPAMGTGGFLITYLQHILQQSKEKNIPLDWDFIKTEGLYGKELVPDTYQLAVSNMLISSGRMFEHLEHGDSIRVPITRKFDNILANPPFGVEGMKYDDCQSPLKMEYTPIKTDSAIALFIQAIIYMLKINGKCAIVLPDGKVLSSKTDHKLMNVRKYLMKTCELKEVIYLPAGIFTYTPIKTCVFYFVKKQEGSSVLENKIKLSKTQKEIGRDYVFIPAHETTHVQFYDYDPYTDTKTMLVDVPMDHIEKNAYSLNYVEYMTDVVHSNLNSNIVTKPLGELCTFLPKSKRQASYGESQGPYAFYTSSQNCTKYCNTCDYEEESLIIGTGGHANIKYDDQFSCSADNFVLVRKPSTTETDDSVEFHLKYIYYYLLLHPEILQKGFYGVGLQHIAKDFVANISIPLPPLDQATELVHYLDFIYETSHKTTEKKIAELKQFNEYCINIHKMRQTYPVVELGSIIKEVKTGKDVVASDRVAGEYPFYGANGVIDHVNDYLFDGTYLLTARTGSLGSLHITDGKFWCSGDVHRMEFEHETTLWYVYYYLHTVDFQKFRTGAAHPKLSGTNLKSIKIHLPPLECQTEIVTYCKNNQSLIQQLERTTHDNHQQGIRAMCQVLG